jgi:hypothetical protein
MATHGGHRTCRRQRLPPTYPTICDSVCPGCPRKEEA